MKPLSFSSVVGEEAMDGFPSFFESERHMVKKKFLYKFKDAPAQLEVPFPNPLGILQAIAMDLSIPGTCGRDCLMHRAKRLPFSDSQSCFAERT